jgi:hypothetical protein
MILINFIFYKLNSDKIYNQFYFEPEPEKVLFSTSFFFFLCPFFFNRYFDKVIPFKAINLVLNYFFLSAFIFFIRISFIGLNYLSPFWSSFFWFFYWVFSWLIENDRFFAIGGFWNPPLFFIIFLNIYLRSFLLFPYRLFFG